MLYFYFDTFAFLYKNQNLKLNEHTLLTPSFYITKKMSYTKPQ